MPTGDSLEMLIEFASRGELVLFLGAGALAGSRVGLNKTAPLLGDGLRDKLHSQFFPTEPPTKLSLKRVCGNIVAAPGGSEGVLRQALVDLLTPVVPSASLQMIPSISWKAIFTVNVDDAVEKAYELMPDRVQDLCPVVLPGDIEARDPSVEVSLYKLHGCLRFDASNLIFSHRDYTEARERNLRMFSNLASRLCDSPFLFIGFSLEDDDFQDLWTSITKYLGSHSRLQPSYLASPSAQQSLIQGLAAEGIDVIRLGTEDLLPRMKANLSRKPQTLAERLHEVAGPTAASLRALHGASPSESVIAEVKRCCLLLGELTGATVEPASSHFYSGAQCTWDDIQNGLAITRDVQREVLDDIAEWLNRPTPRQMIIMGAAGYGKSVLLMQTAFELHNLLRGQKLQVLYLKRYAELNAASFITFAKDLAAPVIFFIDDASRSLPALRRIHKDIAELRLPVFIVGSSRPADWAVARKVGEYDIQGRRDLPRLSKDEALELARRLKRFGRLGPDVATLSTEDLAIHMVEKSELHLLAALMSLTASVNSKFDEIIADEYFRIGDETAQRLYLLVAIPHAVGLPIPAQLVCSAAGIQLNEYHSTMGVILQATVLEEIEERSRELQFLTQHRVIAETLLHKVQRPDATVENVLSIAKYVNPHNSREYEILRRLYHEDYLETVLQDERTIRSCYEQFMETFPSDLFIKQHFAIFESRQRNYAKAMELIDSALSVESHPHFLNTKANILLKEAVAEPDRGKAEYLLNAGTELLRKRIKKDFDKEIHYLSLIEKQLEFARRRDLKEEQRVAILEEAEADIGNATRHYPLSSELGTLAGKLQLELQQIPQAKKLLERSIRLDGANTRARILRAKIHFNEGEVQAAFDLVEKGLINSSDSFGLAKMRVECARKLKFDWRRYRQILNDYLQIAENDVPVRVELICRLMEVADLKSVKRQLDILRKCEAPRSTKFKCVQPIERNGQPLVVEGSFHSTRFGRGYVHVDGYPNYMGAYLDLKSLSRGDALRDGGRVSVELAVNGFGLAVCKLITVG